MTVIYAQQQRTRDEYSICRRRRTTVPDDGAPSPLGGGTALHVRSYTTEGKVH